MLTGDRIYIAASSKEIERAERLMAIARARGFVFHDWTVTVREAMAAGKSEIDLSDEFALMCALGDIGGLVNAKRLIVLVPPADKPAGFGVAAELGAAHIIREFLPRPASMPPLEIIACGDSRSVRRSVFTRLANAFVERDVDALEPNIPRGAWWQAEFDARAAALVALDADKRPIL